MKKRLVLALALLAGCTNVTTMKILRAKDGTVNISSGKDVSFSSLSYTNPSGETLDVKGYTSNANTDAINAQTLRERQQLDALMKAIELGKALAGAARP